MKKHLAHLAAALAVTLLFGAAAGPLSAAAAAPTAILDEENTAAAESRLNQERLYLENIGGTAALRASVAVENGDAVPITWTTSNPAAATVDPFGLVTAVGDGEALITATTPDGHSACCSVYAGAQVAIQEQIEADEAKIALGVLGGFAVLVTVLALAVSGS